jgi:DNA-binding MarR family transcriptional regulator
MVKNDVIQELQQLRGKEILLSFSVPKTPSQVEKELNIKKLKLKTFIERNLIKSLNPESRKGRFYVLTNKAKKILKLPCSYKKDALDWQLMGWIDASPRQRLVVLKVIDSTKRTSENIRLKATKYNDHLTRISSKQILKELISKGLIETEMIGRKRYYWISEKGKETINAVSNYEK